MEPGAPILTLDLHRQTASVKSASNVLELLRLLQAESISQILLALTALDQRRRTALGLRLQTEFNNSHNRSLLRKRPSRQKKSSLQKWIRTTKSQGLQSPLMAPKPNLGPSKSQNSLQ